MAEIPTTVVDKAAWVDLQELDAHGEGLTQFEVDFVESVMQQLRAGRTLKASVRFPVFTAILSNRFGHWSPTLTEKQRAKLDSIREERL